MSIMSPVLLREEIGRRLRAARESAGLSANEAAARLEVSRTTICRVETGQQGTNVHMLRSIMDLYDFRDDEPRLRDHGPRLRCAGGRRLPSQRLRGPTRAWPAPDR